MRSILLILTNILIIVFIGLVACTQDVQPSLTSVPQPTDTVTPSSTQTHTPTPTPTPTNTPTATATPTIEFSSTPVPATSEANRESLTFVLIEKQNPAYTVYFGIPESMDEESLDEIKVLASEEENIQIIGWEDFEGIDLESEIILDEYENPKVGEGIVELIQVFPLTPFGLTWNGGIALTFNDYQFAENIYQQYQDDPDNYLQTNERDLNRDPINPQNHLGPLLDK